MDGKLLYKYSDSSLWWTLKNNDNIEPVKQMIYCNWQTKVVEVTNESDISHRCPIFILLKSLCSMCPILTDGYTQKNYMKNSQKL